MSLETLTKDALLGILEDKKTILGMKEKDSKKAPKINLSAELVRTLTNARCRLCHGQTYEVADEGNPTGKTTLWLGQPITASAGGNKLACRTCRHIRNALPDYGVVDLYI